MSVTLDIPEEILSTISGSTTTASTTAGSVGTYTLLVTNTANGCTAVSSVVVDKDQNIPTAVVAPPAILTCAVQSVTINAVGTTPGLTYTWSGPGLSGGQGTLQPTVNAPGTYTLLVFNSANSCSATLSVPVIQDIAPPTANAGQSATLNCVVPTLDLDGTASSTGPGFAYDEIVPAIERIVMAYLEHREAPSEKFLDAYRRLGLAPFKAALYPAEAARDAA